MSKYGNKKVTADGMTFDSKEEYKRYCELSLLEKAGEITQLRCQVKFVLIPAQYEPDIIGPRGGRKRGKLLEREISYIADFTYVQNGKTIVEDSKGFQTPEYKMKRKMMLYFHNIRIKETGRKRNYGRTTKNQPFGKGSFGNRRKMPKQ